MSAFGLESFEVRILCEFNVLTMTLRACFLPSFVWVILDISGNRCVISASLRVTPPPLISQIKSGSLIETNCRTDLPQVVHQIPILPCPTGANPVAESTISRDDSNTIGQSHPSVYCHVPQLSAYTFTVVLTSPAVPLVSWKSLSIRMKEHITAIALGESPLRCGCKTA